MSEQLSKAKKAYIIGKRFVDDFNIINFNGVFYEYTGKIWEELDMEAVDSLIHVEFIKEFSPPLSSDIKEICRSINNITHSVYRIQIKKLKEDTLNGDINLKDYIYNLNTEELRGYTKEEFKFFKLSFNYDKNKKLEKDNLKVFYKFLCDSFEIDLRLLEGTLNQSEYTAEIQDQIDTINFVKEWFGYSLMPGNPYHKALIMTGQGRNGKGVLKNIWTSLIGKQNSSFIDLHAINDEKIISSTRGKLINFSTDNKHGVQLDTGVIKAAVAGEEVTANEKYKQPQTFKFTAKLIVACNELPYVKTVGSAVSDRFHVLPFKKTVKQENVDPYLTEKIEKEIEDIFIWSMKGLATIKRRGHFKIPNRVQKSLDKFLVDNDSVSMFIEHEEIKGEKYEANKYTLYNDYKYYCLTSAYKAIGRNKFYERLELKGYKTRKTSSIRYIVGLKNVELQLDKNY